MVYEWQYPHRGSNCVPTLFDQSLKAIQESICTIARDFARGFVSVRDFVRRHHDLPSQPGCGSPALRPHYSEPNNRNFPRPGNHDFLSGEIITSRIPCGNLGTRDRRQYLSRKSPKGERDSNSPVGIFRYSQRL